MSCSQAEELNTIVGNAFRMAYVAQLQRQPILQDVISPRSAPSYRKDKQEHRTSWVRVPERSCIVPKRKTINLVNNETGREG